MDSINLANLNAHFSIPVLNKAGRGTNFFYILDYDSSVWYPASSNGTASWQPVPNWGWTAQTSASTGWVSYSSSVVCIGHNQCLIYDGNFKYSDFLGAPHYFNLAYEYSNAWTCSSATAVATDGSGYTLQCPSFNVTTASGKLVVAPVLQTSGAATTTDRNGNEIPASTSGVFTDTLGTTALTIAGSGTPASAYTLTYTAPSGASAQYTMVFTQYTVRTNFGCSGIVEFGANGTTTENLVSEIVLPDSTKYVFSYEQTPGYPSDVTGRLASVQLPTGGTISYGYSGGTGSNNSGIVCLDGSTATLARSTPDTGSNSWTYAHSEAGPAWSTTITDPQNNQTAMNFQGIYPTETQVYQGSTSGTLLQTTYTCYNGSTWPCNSTAITLPITQRTHVLQWPGSSGLESKNVTSYNANGLVTEKDEYAYGAGSPGALTRKTLTSYATLSNNIVSAPASVIVEDGSGNIKAQTTYTYDQSAVTPTSGTPQHNSVTGSRGNATTVTYLVSGSTTLNKTMTYYDTGNVETSTDVNGASTSYTYGICGNSFPTAVSEPLSLSRSMAWNCTGGVEISLTDENSQTSSTGYTDPYFWRPNSTTDQISNTTNLTYTGQTSVESTLIFNSNSSTMDVLVTRDGLGRSHLSQKKEAPASSTYDSVETDYDSLGRPDRGTLPYSGTAGQTNSSGPSSNTTFDALNRKTQVTNSGGLDTTYAYSQNDTYQIIGPAPTGENAKRKQLEYDALHRLSSVCEVTSGTGSATCGQTSAQIGYWTEYTYDLNNNLTGVTQNAQSSNTQTRAYTYDDLGRMTSETNPESGTTSYTYDTDSTCGTSQGDLVKKIDAVGNDLTGDFCTR